MLAAEGTRYLRSELETLGLQTWPSHTNFVWVDLKRSAREVHEAMLRLGVIIRPMSGNFARITAGRPAENERCIAAVKQVLESGS